MQFIEKPEVFLLASSHTEGDIYDYLISMDAEDFDPKGVDEPDDFRIPSDAEAIVEVAGRACYRSFKPGLNPNVTRVREGNKNYLGNIIKQGHGSVFEHASATFAFVGVSRVFTHELVRHRAGTAFSQESLRYVRLDNLKAWYPSAFGMDTMISLADALGHDEEWAEDRAAQLCHVFQETFERLEELQKDIAELLELDNCKNFTIKKKITSAMRRMAPIGLGTAIIFTTNHRNLRHLIEMRTSRHAEEEIRVVFEQVAQICADVWPNLYQDAKFVTVDGIDEITFENRV